MPKRPHQRDSSSDCTDPSTPPQEPVYREVLISNNVFGQWLFHKSGIEHHFIFTREGDVSMVVNEDEYSPKSWKVKINVMAHSSEHIEDRIRNMD